MEINELLSLTQAFNALPGISKKAAEKIVYFLLDQSDQYIFDFIEKLKSLKQNIDFCNFCNNIIKKFNDCEICSDQNRQQNKLCIVSSINNLNSIEATNKYNGLYFILNFELDNKIKINSSQQNIIENLKKIIIEHHFDEILIATNLTIKGEITAYFLSDLISKLDKNIVITRLASGIPVNSRIEYIDCETLSFSIQNRTKITK